MFAFDHQGLDGRETDPVRAGCLDVRRAFGIARFFSFFSFETGDELLRTVSGLEIDPRVVAPSIDLRIGLMSGSLYWLLYLKGYIQFAESGEVDDRNVYYRFMVDHYDAAAHDPGIAEVIAQPEQARAMVYRRFGDVEIMRKHLAHDLSLTHLIAPIEVIIRDPPSERATIVFELDSDLPIIGEIDGYHRLFAARVFGVRWLRCRITEEAAEATSKARAGLRKMIRLAIPFDANVVVPSDPKGYRAELGSRPQTPVTLAAEEAPEDDAVRGDLGRIEAARGRGSEFLLLSSPLPGEAWPYTKLAAECDLRYRRVARQEDIGAIYSLVNAPEITEGIGPLPPPEFTHLAIGIRDPHRFVASGLTSLQSIETLLALNGYHLDEFESVLDFGCGCGRLLRHMKDASSELYGADYNPYLIEWCRQNLSFARFVQANDQPPLPFGEGVFDCVLSVATFAHLNESRQRPWMDEIARVLRPNGMAVITVHGLSRAAELPADLNRRFTAGEVVSIRPALSGTNACATYHPESYMRTAFARELELIAHVPGGAADVRQDLVLYRKRNG